MYEYIKGKVVDISSEYIIVENNNFAYRIYITEKSYKLDESVLIYIYFYISDNSRLLYGFKTKLEREVFYKLLQLKSIGIKTAFNILRNDNYELILNAAFTNNYDFLLTINKISEKNVDLLIKTLKTISYNNFYKIDETYYLALKQLDYSDSSIYKSYQRVNKNLSSNLMIKEGIRLIESGELQWIMMITTL